MRPEQIGYPAVSFSRTVALAGFMLIERIRGIQTVLYF